MITKSSIKAGETLKHKFLGIVTVDESCVFMNKVEADPTSVFVVHDKQIKEISLALLYR